MQGNVDAVATARYLQKEKEFFLYKERVKLQLYTTVGLIIIMLAFAVIVWLQQRVRLQSARNEVLLAEASGLKNQLTMS